MRTVVVALAAVLTLSTCASAQKKPAVVAKPESEKEKPAAVPDPTKKRIAFSTDKVPGWKMYPPPRDAGNTGLSALIQNAKTGAQIQVYLHLTDATVATVLESFAAEVVEQGASMTPDKILDFDREGGALAFEIEIRGQKLFGRAAVFEAHKDPRLVALLIGLWPIGTDESSSADFVKIARSFQLLVQ